ncbi:DUF6894 family protein [Sphingomonas solaris]
MPHYFFHLYNDLTVSDDEGSDLPGIDAAREYAIKSIRGLICEDVHKGCVNLRHRIEVADASGELLLTITYAEVVEVRT